MWLICSRRCGGGLFRAVSAEVDLDESGEYQGHRVVQPAYLCLNCGAPAVDLGEVPAAMEAEAELAAAVEPVDVLCPVCETLVQLDPELECPNCGSPLEPPQAVSR